MRCCLSSAAILSAMFVLPTCADGLYFFILAATCCATSAEICLDLVGPPVAQGFLTCECLCASGCFVTTHLIHGIVHALISCICGVCDNLSVPLFYLYLVSHRLRQLSC